MRVNGTVTVSDNPDYVQWYGTPFAEEGTYGPFGTSQGELVVGLKARFADGSGTNTLNFVNPQYNSGTSGPDSARSDVLYASKQIEVQAGRSGIAGVANDNCCHWRIGMFALAASQTVTVEQVTDVAHVVANPVAVHPNTQVTFTTKLLSASVCTAVLSLAPPNGSEEFTKYSWMHWNGFILNHDILAQLLPATVSVYHQQGTLSALYDRMQIAPDLILSLAWGLQIHAIENYVVDQRDLFRAELVPLIDTCYGTLPREATKSDGPLGSALRPLLATDSVGRRGRGQLRNVRPKRGSFRITRDGWPPGRLRGAGSRAYTVVDVRHRTGSAKAGVAAPCRVGAEFLVQVEARYGSVAEHIVVRSGGTPVHRQSWRGHGRRHALAG